MARYTEKPVTMLSLVSLDSEDGDPPFTSLEVKWKGQIIPYLETIQVRGKPPYPPTITITLLADRKNAAATALPFWRAMQRDGVVFTNLPSLTEELVRVGLRVCKKECEISASGATSITVKDLLEAGMKDLPEELKDLAIDFFNWSMSSRALQEDFAQGRYAHFWEQANKRMVKFGHPKVPPVPIDPATL